MLLSPWTDPRASGLALVWGKLGCPGPHPLPTAQSPLGLGKRCNRPVPTGGQAQGIPEGFKLVPQLSWPLISSLPLARANLAPPAGLPEAHMDGRVGDTLACAFLG